MTAGECNVKGTVVPTLRYRDVPEAIDWLCTAFGFAKHLVVSGEDGAIRYAQLTFGDGMIMLSAADEEDVDRLMAQPDETGGRETQICYLFIEDARAHCARAREAGAMIVLDIDDESSDGRAYSCRDPEGHVWNFGTYDPRRKATAAQPQKPKPRRTKVQSAARFVALGTGMVANAVTSIAFIAWICAATQPAISVAFAALPDARQDPGGTPAAALELTVKETRDQLVREAAARETAERGAREVREQLARERTAKDAAERAAAEARDALARERNARPAADDKEARAALRNAEQAAEDARKRLQEADGAAQKAREEATRERTGREAAERTAAEARDQLAKEKSLRETAERAAKEARDRARDTAKAPSKRPPPAKKAASSGGALWQ